MHKSKIAVLATCGLGLIAMFLPFAHAQAFIFKTSVNGIDEWPGYVVLGLLAVAGVLAMTAGTKEEGIPNGGQKIGIMICGGLLLLFTGFAEVVYVTESNYSPGVGLHLALLCSLALIVIPFVFKADGSVGVPSMKEIADDLEESGDIMEDQFEEMGDKIEDMADKVEDSVEKKFGLDDDDEDDDDDKDEKKEEAKAEEAPAAESVEEAPAAEESSNDEAPAEESEDGSEETPSEE